MVVCVVRLFIVHCYVIGMYYINVCSCISQSVCKVCKSVCRTYIESISASHELDSKYCYMVAAVGCHGWHPSETSRTV